MSQYVETPTRAFVAGAARDQFLRVKLSGTSLATAGATDVSIGTQERESFAATDVVPVRLRSAQGTKKMVASEAIIAGNPVYAAASGKVAASGTVYEGIALEAAGANNDVIEVMPAPNVDVASTITGTNAATFTVDADLAKPKISLASQTGGTGDYTTTLKPESTLSGNNAIIVPEADGDTLVAVALTQTLTNKTLTAPVLGALITFSNTTTPVAAAGTTVADAGQLPSTMVSHITSDGATKGVKLPAVTAGGVVMIVVNDSSTAAELYAESTGTVNGGSADASVVIPASKGVLCISTAAKTWKVFDLPAAAAAS